MNLNIYKPLHSVRILHIRCRAQLNTIMIYTEQNIEKAVSNLVSKNQALIVRHYDGYIILAQNERDFQIKVSKIQRGDTLGFYTVERALSLNCT